MTTIRAFLLVSLAAVGVAAAPPAMAGDWRGASLAAAPQVDTWDRNGERTVPQARATAAAERVYRETRVWRGNDGRTYCRKRDGSTGVIVGSAAPAGGVRSFGDILGAAAGVRGSGDGAREMICR